MVVVWHSPILVGPYGKQLNNSAMRKGFVNV